MTFIYEVTNLTRTVWKCTACANINFLRQGFRKLSSDRHSLHTDRHTDTTEIIYDTASRVVKNTLSYQSLQTW